MKFELESSAESSRFILALMLSSATALLVAAPLLVAMMRTEDPIPVTPAGQTILQQDTQPAPPSLGIDETEVGRIDEASPESGPALTPAGPTQTLTAGEPSPTTKQAASTVAPTTTVRPTTTAPRPEPPPPFRKDRN